MEENVCLKTLPACKITCIIFTATAVQVVKEQYTFEKSIMTCVDVVHSYLFHVISAEK